MVGVPGMQGQLHGADVVEMCTAWCIQNGLDQGSLEALLTLPIDQMSSVMANFAPKADTKNANALFMSYVNSMKQGMGLAAGLDINTLLALQAQGVDMSGNSALSAQRANEAAGGPTEMELLSFAQIHGLDQRCLEMLMSQPIDVQRKSMDEFQPKAGTRDVNSLFNGFMRSVAARLKGKGKGGATATGTAGKSLPVGPLKRKPGEDPIDLPTFCATWGLDAEALAALQNASPAVQNQVLDSFQVKEGTRDVKRLFMGFLKSVTMSGGTGKKARV
eukprot:gnl/TRDRNA2_/TRDRNA2_88688_c0_seq1.p1 gnl/TRDRNA2_/TRDRNA2_88688_c0~~gnl/TRDRNA2_/TRDRNA2_88688_c0_seq1.p1  ORF type:complete len:315 (-),score=63.35 gnl/TRDRNA2_/TRDRNA2_88688_c0_seq1:87-911(-)